ncbi:MAG TPA: accessory factor UbiK family protein [Methylophilaceae bacterium]
MLSNQILQDLSLKIKELSSSSPLADLEKNIHALLQGALTKLELVSREEFDVQAELLRVTREKLDLLQERLDALESSRNSAQ